MLFFIHTTRMPSRPEICPYKTNKKNKYSKEKKIFKLMEFERPTCEVLLKSSLSANLTEI